MRLIDIEMINSIRAETLMGNLIWERGKKPELFHAKNERYEISVGYSCPFPSDRGTAHVVLHIFDLGCESEEIPAHSDLGHAISCLHQDIIEMTT